MTDVAAPADACPRCGEDHALIRCPYVKAMEFVDGDINMLRRVEFLTPSDFGNKVAGPKPADVPSDDYPRLGPSGAR